MHLPANMEGVLARATDATLLVDESGTILRANAPACRALKYGEPELTGQTLELLVPERFRFAHIHQRLRFTDHRRSRPMGTGLELWALCKDGTELAVDISLMPAQHGLTTLMLVVILPRATAARVARAD